MRSAVAGKGQHQDVGIGTGTTRMMHNEPPPARREITSRPSAVDTGFTSIHNTTANYKVDDSNVAPNTTMSLSPWKLEDDPHAPKDPHAPHISEVKVHDPSNRGSEEAAGRSQVFDSFARMKVDDKEPNRTGSPRGLVQEQGGEDQTNYAQKISAVGSAVSGKAVAAKDFVASKLGYGETTEETTTNKSSSSSPLEYGKKIALTVTEKLKPGEEDRALSEVISEAWTRRKDEVVKVGESAFGRPPSKGEVTESEELTRRLGKEDKEATEKSSVARAAAATGRSVVGMVKDTVGSWLGNAGEQSVPSQQSLGTSQGVEGFVDSSSSRRQAEHGGKGAEVRRLQGSAN
uniref:Low-temperature-induced 65 kDa protein n=2 Tax=Cucumis sativus TaxID=3659 RepID=A0A0A0LIE7_CUCSA